jgi:hypothetical protein
MKKLLFLLFLQPLNFLFAQAPAENYPVDLASVEQPGVPKGETIKFTFDQSLSFPALHAIAGCIYLRSTVLINQPAYM